MLDWQVSAAGQIFAPAKSAFTQHLNSIAQWLWSTILDHLGAEFTASRQASDRTLNKAHKSRTLLITKSLVRLGAFHHLDETVE